MSELLDKIAQHGRWEVTIRPEKFDALRVANISDLEPILRKAQVNGRYGFPFLPTQRAEVELGVDRISYPIEKYHVLESWAFFQSGLFYHVAGFADDWRSDAWWKPPPTWKPDQQLEVMGTLGRFLEIFQLAASLALSPAGSSRTFIEINLIGLKGREIWIQSPRRMGFYPGQYPRATIDRLPFKETFDTVELEGRHRELAMGVTSRLFQRFHWNVEAATILDLAAEALPQR